MFEYCDIMMSERDISRGCKRGNANAQRALFDRYSPMLMAKIFSYVGNDDDAKDVLQDTFIKAYTMIDHFAWSGEGSLKAWVSRIVANKAINYIREHERISYVTTFHDKADEQEEPDVRDVPPDVLTEMIGRLPTNYRMVLNLFVFEQRSHKEIAQILGIKENTSSSQFFRAKQLLAKMLNEYLNKNKT